MCPWRKHLRGGQIATPLGLEFDTAGGRQLLQCWNTEGIFRLIQSIPSSKAEPFKRWLAKVGYERIQEIEDPELATKRTRALYKAKGYSDDWIEKRMRSIAIRDELTDEWKKRGVKDAELFQVEEAPDAGEPMERGFADVWKKAHFAWEYKGKKKNLEDVVNPDQSGIGTVRFPRLEPRDTACAAKLRDRTLAKL